MVGCCAMPPSIAPPSSENRDRRGVAPGLRRRRLPCSGLRRGAGCNSCGGRAMTGPAGRTNGAPRGLAGPKAEKAVSLALQGGGAYGAFTWGVLDALLEDGRLAIEAVTGASAGSVNAVVLAEGWLEGGAEGARAQLHKFWQRVSLDGALPPAQRHLLNLLLGYWHADGSPARTWLDAWASTLSPTERNPLDINPLRDALTELIDF